MKSKLTLSITTGKIQSAKRIAKWRNTTVSALFEESVDNWERAIVHAAPEAATASTELQALLGAFQSQPAFDQKSAQIRRKHG